MRKRTTSLALVLFAAGFFAFTFFACNDADDESDTQFTINISAITGGGVSVRGGMNSADAGSTITLDITENAGFMFNSLTVTKERSGQAVRHWHRTFTMPPANVNITASFISTNDQNPEIDGMRIGDQVPGKGRLVWRDEFLGLDAELDRGNWNPETGTGAQYGIPGWGNRELQWYRPENVWVEDGSLVIEARQQSPSISGMNFTSGRITTGQTRLTAGGQWTPETFYVTTGRVEGRMRTPRGRGFWPAFWLLGSNSYGPVREHPHQVWPLCAEIDIMEFFGGEEHVLVNAIHFGQQYGGSVDTRWRFRSFYAGIRANGSVFTGTRAVVRNTPGTKVLADDFHVYGVQWDETGVQWELNGHVLQRRTWAQIDDRAGALGPGGWMSNFYNDAGFSIILNIAIGGNMGQGSPAAESFNDIDNRLTVDWVRVFCTQ